MLISPPERFWMRTCEFSVVIMWFGPTAPMVSGGMNWPLSSTARKLAAGGGDASDAEARVNDSGDDCALRSMAGSEISGEANRSRLFGR